MHRLTPRRDWQELMAESLNVNYIDEAEYPSTTEIHNQCAALLTCVGGA